jgi:23S rRNA (guanosine2251-2'-O)-methyltransferase
MKGWIHGLHAVEEAIAAAPGRIARVVVATGRDDGPVRRLLEAARSAGVTIERRPLRDVERLAGEKTVHQGVVALLAEAAEADPEALLNAAPAPALFVVLDGVEDPHNLGAVVRSAGLSTASVKASAGAALRLPVARTGNLAAFLRRLKEKGIWVVGLDPSGEPLWTGFDLKQPVALVLGGEEKGLRRLTREHCDALLALPLAGGVESLNVSVAAGIALYEVVRQRRERT